MTDAMDLVRTCTLSIRGMTCQSCVAKIQTEVTKKPGIIRAKVDLDDARGRFDYDPSVAAPDLIREYVQDLGFEASLDHFAPPPPPAAARSESCEISIQGMRCHKCVDKIETALAETEGVIRISVGLENKKARAEFDPSRIAADDVAAEIGKLGYVTEVLDRSGGGGVSSPSPRKKKSVTIGAEQEEDDEDDLENEKCFVRIRGMTCASCVAAIEKHAMKVRGVSCQCFVGP